MGKLTLAAGAMCLAFAISGRAQAQALPDTKFLDDFAARRNAEMPPRSEQRAHAPTQREALQPTRRSWVCMSTTPWQPVLASPSPRAAVIGRTQPQIAVSGNRVDGYAEVLFYNGKLGFVPASQIQPYHSEVNPHGTCTVAGVRADNSPVFAYR